MMAFSQVTNTSYHIDQTNETYQFIGGEKPGGWACIGATILGLVGEVDEDAFLKLMEGISPTTGEYLFQQNGKKHRPGFDVVFNAPKDVSVAWARADSKLRLIIESAHNEAVCNALNFIELHAAYTRRGKNGVHHEQVVGLISALFQHSTSRLNDPHLHTHAVIKNCAKRLDGTYGSLESMYILKWQKAASFIYKAILAENLREYGFNTFLSGQSFGLHGIPTHICEHFSKRKKEIKAALDAKGINTARAANLAAKMTRGKKQAVDRPRLFNEWKTEMDKLGFSEDEFNKLINQSLGLHLLKEGDLTEVKFNHQYLCEHLTQSRSVFSEINVYNLALTTAMTLAIPAKAALTLAESFLESELILELQTGNKYERQFTTHKMRQLENQLIKTAKKLNGRTFIAGLSINDILKAQTRTGLVLSEEQQEAVLGVLGNSSMEIMSGSAGSGKSTAMLILSDIYCYFNVKVWGAAIAKSAAKNLEKETNIQSFTVAKLLIDLDNGWSKIRENDVVVVDEAGQIGVRQMLKLQEHAIKKRFKLVLTGDDKQLDAIEHGGVLRYLSRPNIIGTTRIETIMRQNQEWDRTAVANFRDGKAIDGLKEYKRHKRLHFNKDANSTHSALIADWNKFRQETPNKNNMVLARTWNDVLELNRLMRSQLQSSGEVERQDIEITGVVSSKEINYLLSVNDRVRFTHNDSNLGCINGHIGTVVTVIKNSNELINIKIRRDDGIIVTITKSNYSNDKGQIYLAPAYAQTIYSSQGQTVNGNVFVLHDAMIDRANAYVALSRHKDDCQLYVAMNVLFDDCENPMEMQATDKEAIAKLAEQYASEKRSVLSIEYESIVKDVYNNENVKANIEYEFGLT